MTLLVNEIVGLYNSLEKGMVATFFCITGLLVTRWVFWKHFPLSDLYESLIFLSWKKTSLSAIPAPSAIFTPSICYVGPLNSNASICNILLSNLNGAVWANEAWGSYWNWDPKETWALITWTVFAIYLHIRTNKNLRGANSAIVAFIGFLIIWICYFGVNLLGIGLHSYGSFTL
ncbi:Cytochrome c biogenesis protein CcsA [Bienertia sinuspersici]